jgi:O-antigen/teichoic acid export membrane protein
MISRKTDELIVDRGRTSSVVWVLAATIVAGISGYLVLWAVARAVGAADYAIFGVFWSGLFLIVGVLFGVQQETTRATADAMHREVAANPRSSLWAFSGGLALVVVAVVFVTGIWWGPATLGVDQAGLTLQIAVGSAANAVVATMSGMVAGARMWRHLGAIIAIDGLLRLLGVLLVLNVSTDPSLLAWAVIIPFPLSLGIVILISPRPFLRLSRSSLSYRRLTANSLHTMLAASATALVINGFPLLLSFFALATEKALLGALILAITITRAPVLVPLMALQSYLVTRFTGMTTSPWLLIRRAFVGLAAVMVLFAGATALWGTAAFELLIGEEFALSTAALVPLVVSSGFIGALCVTGPALLACGHHRGYAAGWLVSSVVAVGLLFLPLDLATKAALALSVGPICGLVVHMMILRTVTMRS